MLYKSQYGFGKKHCTSHAVTEITDLIYENGNDGKLTCVIALDLREAYDDYFLMY